ncbi:hypothetical protein HAV22_22530 [Massilia sp. TW-1]|uniref:Uncharacterized protein n=1 Tax=Telluria antibiotica TaxID=2717319 RepID=A0ABX0PKE1_9BURK|nr:hypothetical protein [Telluria antibiotica]NIA56410.1 hypothetical protein [Telluria antibiotica]
MHFLQEISFHILNIGIVQIYGAPGSWRDAIRVVEQVTALKAETFFQLT